MEPTRRNLPIFHFLTICCTIQFFQWNWSSTEFQLKLNGVVYARLLAYTLPVQVYHMCASICDVMLQAPNMWCNAANIYHKMLSSPQEHFPFVRAIANVWHFNSFSITPQFKHGIVSLLIVTFLFCCSSYHADFLKIQVKLIHSFKFHSCVKLMKMYTAYNVAVLLRGSETPGIHDYTIILPFWCFTNIELHLGTSAKHSTPKRTLIQMVWINIKTCTRVQSHKAHRFCTGKANTSLPLCHPNGVMEQRGKDGTHPCTILSAVWMVCLIQHPWASTEELP